MMADRPRPVLNDAALTLINGQRLAEQADPNRQRMTGRRNPFRHLMSQSTFSRGTNLIGLHPYHLGRVIIIPSQNNTN